jgi:hypothetical protein
MPSKQVVDRQKEAQAVSTAGNTHAAEIAKGLAALLTPELGRGEKLPDVELLLKLAMRALDRASAEMGAADEAYQHELLDDDPPRKERDEAALLLRERLIGLRDTLSGLFGEQGVKAAGFTDKTPSDPTLLARFAGDVSKGLRKARLPQSRLPGVKFATSEVCDELDTQRQRLEKALADVSRETREAQAKASARQAVTDAFDERYAGIANFVIGLLKLAGKHDLAGKVRLVWRRSAGPGSPTDPDPTDPPADPSPPTP